MVEHMGFEPMTFCLQSRHSSAELMPRSGTPYWNRTNILSFVDSYSVR